MAPAFQVFRGVASAARESSRACFRSAAGAISISRGGTTPSRSESRYELAAGFVLVTSGESWCGKPSRFDSSHISGSTYLIARRLSVPGNQEAPGRMDGAGVGAFLLRNEHQRSGITHPVAMRYGLLASSAHWLWAQSKSTLIPRPTTTGTFTCLTRGWPFCISVTVYVPVGRWPMS